MSSSSLRVLASGRACRLLLALLCLSVAGSPSTVAQSPNVDADTSRYVTQTWTTEDGLPQNAAWALEQDDAGYLWVGTLQGLARFDGHAFTTYDAARTEGLAGNRIQDITQSSAGPLWICTESGVSVRREGRFRQIDGPRHTRSVAEGSASTMWLGGGSGFYRATLSGATKIPLPDSLAGQTVWDVEAVSPDSVWLAIEGGNLLLHHDGTFQLPSGLPSNTSVRRVASAADGGLWVATRTSVLHVQNGIYTRYSYDGAKESEIRPHEVRVAPSGIVWLTTYESGLFRLSGSSFRRLRLGGRIPKRVAGLHRDEYGQWWVGTLNDGLIRLRSRLFHPVNAPGAGGRPTHGVYADDRGVIWVGTSGGGLLRVDDSTTARWSERDGLPNATIWSVARDHTGALWVALNWSEVLRGRKHRFEPVQAADGDSFSKVNTLYRDPSGALWIGSSRQGIHRYVQESLQRVIPAHRIPSPVTTLHVSTTRALWIGTNADGVARYENGTLTWYDADDGVPYRTVRDVYETNDGTLWVATYGGGIARFESTENGGSFTPVTPADGLPDGTIHTIREAPEGVFWMTSNGGVFRVHRAQVEAVADGRRDRLYAQTFGPADGMPTRECNGNVQPAIAEGPDGHFWIPTMKGLTTVDPQNPRLAVPDSLPLRVTEVRTDGTPHPVDSLQVSPSTYRLAIDFTGISLRHADDLSFRYRLDDGPWTPTQSRHTAEFTTLDAGTHRFDVQATLNGEKWYTLDVPLRFTVAPRFYETGWFRLLLVLGLLGLVGGAYAWRTRALRRRQEQLSRMVDERTAQLVEEKQKTERQAERLEAIDDKKNRFFANVSHELRTPLTILKGTTADLLGGSFGDLPTPVQHQLEIMRSNVHRLRRLTDQLLDLARLETADPELDAGPHDLVVLLRQTVRSFAPLAERRGLDLSLDTTVETHPCRVDAEKWEKIVSNLLSNALQHTPEGGTVRVELDVEESDPATTVLRVVDTGRGIAPERQDEIFERFAHGEREDTDRSGTGIGLSLVREYVDLHDGTITLDSTLGEGSTFTVRLPLPPPDPDTAPSDGSVEADDAPPMVPEESVPSSTSDGAPEGDQPVLLIVEDNTDVRAYLRRHLVGSYRVIEETSGADGLSMAREAEPDLILTDLMMPEMDGTELCRAIRDDEALGPTPVLLLTARAAEEDAVAALEAGADGYVTKPFSIAELKARLQRLLEAHWAGIGKPPTDGLLAPDVEVTSADEEFLTRVTDAIDNHLSRSDFTVEDLAAEVGLSPRQLQRKLKRLTNTSPAAFIRRYRLDVAAQLLEKEAGTVSEIAYQVGFGTPDTFTTRFEERFNCSPSAYPEDVPPTPTD